MQMKTTIIAAVIAWGASSAMAADDPSIPVSEKERAHRAMNQHIGEQSFERGYPIFDPESRSLVYLKLKELHRGVVKKGGFYVSCADFTGPKGAVYDVDFLVGVKGDSYRVMEALVHSKAGRKSAYHVDH